MANAPETPVSGKALGIENTLQTPMSRRAAIKGAVGALGAAMIARAQTAEASQENSDPQDPTQLISEILNSQESGEQEVYDLDELVAGDGPAMLLPKVLKPDPELAERPITPITGFGFNSNAEMFQGLDPSDPALRAREALIRGFALAEAVRQDTEYMKQFTEDELLLLASPVAERANALQLQEPIPYEEMLTLMKDPSYTVPLYAYEEGEANKDNYDVYNISPHLPFQFRLLRGDRPETQSLISLYGVYGITPRAIKHNVIVGGAEQSAYGLGLDIYIPDDSFKGAAYPPQQNADVQCSLMFHHYLESIPLIRPDAMEYYNQPDPDNNFNPYWQLHIDTKGFNFYPEIENYILGPADDAGFNESAPVLHITSPALSK